MFSHDSEDARKGITQTRYADATYWDSIDYSHEMRNWNQSFIDRMKQRHAEGTLAYFESLIFCVIILLSMWRISQFEWLAQHNLIISLLPKLVNYLLLTLPLVTHGSNPGHPVYATYLTMVTTTLVYWIFFFFRCLSASNVGYHICINILYFLYL